MRCEHGDVVGVGYQGCSQGPWLYTTLHSAVLRGTMRYYPSRNKSLASNECPMGNFPVSSLSKWDEPIFLGGWWLLLPRTLETDDARYDLGSLLFDTKKNKLSR